MTKKSVRNGFIAVLVIMLMVAGFGPVPKQNLVASCPLQSNFRPIVPQPPREITRLLKMRAMLYYENLLAAWRAKRGLILSLAIAFVALQTCDAFFTMWAMNHGFQEVNPYLAGIAGSWLSPVVKILPAALVSFGVVKAGKRFPVAATVGLSAVVAVE